MWGHGLPPKPAQADRGAGAHEFAVWATTAQGALASAPLVPITSGPAPEIRNQKGSPVRHGVRADVLPFLKPAFLGPASSVGPGDPPGGATAYGEPRWQACWQGTPILRCQPSVSALQERTPLPEQRAAPDS